MEAQFLAPLLHLLVAALDIAALADLGLGRLLTNVPGCEVLYWSVNVHCLQLGLKLPTL
jgi:hypothetical protein